MPLKRNYPNEDYIEQEFVNHVCPYCGIGYPTHGDMKDHIDQTCDEFDRKHGGKRDMKECWFEIEINGDKSCALTVRGTIIGEYVLCSKLKCPIWQTYLRSKQ